MVKERDALKINNSYESEPSSSNGVSFCVELTQHRTFSINLIIEFSFSNRLVVKRCIVE